jgi:hypothetical protein
MQHQKRWPRAFIYAGSGARRVVISLEHVVAHCAGGGLRPRDRAGATMPWAGALPEKFDHEIAQRPQTPAVAIRPILPRSSGSTNLDSKTPGGRGSVQPIASAKFRPALWLCREKQPFWINTRLTNEPQWPGKPRNSTKI